MTNTNAPISNLIDQSPDTLLDVSVGAISPSGVLVLAWFCRQRVAGLDNGHIGGQERTLVVTLVSIRSRAVQVVNRVVALCAAALSTMQMHGA